MVHETIERIVVIDVVAPPRQVVAVDVYPGGPPGPKGDKGDKGDQGEQGIVGPIGPQGPPAASAQAYSFAGQTTAPPLSGSVRFNNANQAVATLLWLHYTNDDGVDIKTYLTQRLSVGNTVYLQDRDESAKWELFQITAIVDSGTYATLSVIWKAGGQPLTSQQKIIIMRES